MIVIAITTGQFELHEGHQYAGQSPRILKLTQFYRNAVGSGQLKILYEGVQAPENQLVELQAELERKLKTLGGDVSKLIEELRADNVDPAPEEAAKPVAAPKGKAKASKE